jgi:hypothetical protein
MAYCYRFQDLISSINKKNFENNPVQEAKILFWRAMDRETLDVRGNGLQKFKKLLPMALFLFRFIPKKKIKGFVREIDLNHIKLSKEDIYWTNIVDNYNYRGIPFEERLKEYYQEKNNQL